VHRMQSTDNIIRNALSYLLFKIIPVAFLV
jgi:hypothetical protein